MDKQTNQTLNDEKGCEAQERKTNLTMPINSIRTKDKQAYMKQINRVQRLDPCDPLLSSAYSQGVGYMNSAQTRPSGQIKIELHPPYPPTPQRSRAIIAS